MASQTFNLTGVGAQDSATITLAGGDKVRVRTTSITGAPGLQLKVVGNSTTSYVTIDDAGAWVCAAGLSGDVVNLRMLGTRPTDNVVGVIESGA